MIQRGIPTTGLGDMIDSRSLDSQHGGLVQHSANVSCSNFWPLKWEKLAEVMELGRKKTKMYFTVIIMQFYTMRV